MIDLPLPARVERGVVQTSRGPVPVLCGQPRPLGSGPRSPIDVVMASGFFGTKEDFRDMLSLLASVGLRGWAYDYAGQLDPDHGHGDYTIARLAADLRELTYAVTGGRPAHMIGHCLGGFVARSAVLAEPGLARSLTLLSCGPSMREGKHRAMLTGLSQLHRKGGTMVLWPLVKSLLPDGDTIMREFWHTKLATMNSRWVTGMAYSLAAEPDRCAELVASGLPVLLVHGKRDRRLWSPDAYADMARRLGAGHVVIERASHSPNMEQPGPTAGALLDFWAVARPRAARPATIRPHARQSYVGRHRASQPMAAAG